MSEYETMFRPKSSLVESDFEALHDEYKDLTNRERYGKNATLNWAVRLAARHLKNINSEIAELKETKKEVADY